MSLLAAILAAASLHAPPAGSLAARIAAAQPHDTIVVEAGVYRERLRIDKPIRLVGSGRPVLDGGGDGDIVEIVAPDVEFRGFLVRDTGIDLDHENCAIRVLAPRAVVADNVLEDVLFGIDLKDAAGSVVEGNVIGGKDLDIARRGDGLRLWRSDGVRVEGNRLHDGRDAILWYSNDIVVRDNQSTGCRYGFHLMYSDHVTLERNLLRENSVGVYFMYSHSLLLRDNRIERNRGPSGYGLGLKETDRFTVEGNAFAGNRVGIYIDGSPFTTKEPGRIAGNTFAYNDVGITFLPAVRGNVISGNAFVDNFEQVCVQGRGELRDNAFALDDRGNYWSDYAGYDLDRDGVGDWDHESQRLFESLLDREPKLRVFLLSPAQQAIEFVARALPAVRPEPKFTDPAPLTDPPPIAIPLPSPPSSGLAGAAVGLLAGGLALLSLSRSPCGLARVRRRAAGASA